MGVSVFIRGVRNPDGKLADMVDLKFQCEKLNIPWPEELIEYFKGTEAIHYDDREEVIQAATEVSLIYDLKIDGLVSGDVEYGDGLIIDLSKLPDDIVKLRVGMS